VILVVAEQRDQALNRASWEAIAAAQQMAGAWPIAVLALGASVGDVAKQLAQADVAEVLTGEHAALGQYTPDAFTMASSRRFLIASVVTSMPVLRALLRPPLACEISLQRSSRCAYAAATAALPSVEPSSTMRTSMSLTFCASTESRHGARYSSTL